MSRLARLALFVVTAVAVVPLSAATAHADRKSFVNTYEYQTMPEEGLELELWNTQVRPDFHKITGQTMTFQIEVEYGITDHWDAALYQILGNEDSTEPFSYLETKIETRYRFAERGEWPVDVVAYLEVVRKYGPDTWELEPKIILARDFGHLMVAANLFFEQRLGDEQATVPEFALGASYEITPQIKVGAESWGDRENKLNHAWVGPALSWSPSPKLFVTTTGGFGITGPADDFVFSAVVGIHI